VAAKWYLTQAGRAEFGARAARRDTEIAAQEAEQAFEATIAYLDIFQRCNARADRARLKALATEDGWWRDAAIWIDDEWEVTDKSERLLRLAIQNVFWTCPNAGEVWADIKRGRLEMLENQWRGIERSDWAILKAKGQQSAQEAEALDRAYMTQVNAVIEEARRALRQRDMMEVQEQS
jgi:hypothetical protein